MAGSASGGEGRKQEGTELQTEGSGVTPGPRCPYGVVAGRLHPGWRRACWAPLSEHALQNSWAAPDPQQLRTASCRLACDRGANDAQPQGPALRL